MHGRTERRFPGVRGRDSAPDTNRPRWTVNERTKVHERTQAADHSALLIGDQPTDPASDALLLSGRIEGATLEASRAPARSTPYDAAELVPAALAATLAGLPAPSDDAGPAAHLEPCEHALCRFFAELTQAPLGAGSHITYTVLDELARDLALESSAATGPGLAYHRPADLLLSQGKLLSERPEAVVESSPGMVGINRNCFSHFPGVATFAEKTQCKCDRRRGTKECLL
ncbi:hypothetical protein ACFRAO_23635 [Streptomyces sp. NPDC056656]|uniref:hypothetical protein n=1 Tax=Streptomyces sp. NPDC056656 TaxID=3345895 RepID=UPI0036A12E45